MDPEPVMRVADLRVKIFADGASLGEMVKLARQSHIRGFTTNPTLMQKAGVRDYARFAHEVLAAIPNRPIAFEVIADDFRDMERQAIEIASWGPTVYVKVPVMDTRARPSYDLIRRLSHDGVKVNVTAVMTIGQATRAVKALEGGAPSNVSIFAGRIADTGRDPVPMLERAVAIAAVVPSIELIWASPRELLNVFQADRIGCHIVTLTADLLNKLSLVGKDLDEFSRETVQMFRDDAVKAGFALTGKGD